ncbi:MAG: hypothetical protein DI589_14950 [Shinella sp.]|nr:MAG: hypothetical protein DI589_14950 [Shinella sp.]
MNGYGLLFAFRARWSDEISDCRKDGQDALQSAWRPKSSHGQLSLSQRRTRVLGAIGQAIVQAMLDSRHELR